MRPAGIGGRLQATGAGDEPREGQARLDPELARQVHAAADLDVVPLGGANAEHPDGVAVLKRKRWNRSAGKRHVDGHPLRTAGEALRRRHHPFDRHPRARGIGIEAAGGGEQVGEGFVRGDVVRLGTQHATADRDAAFADPDIYHVTVLEAHVVPGVALEQVVVEVERGHLGAIAPHGDGARVRPLGHTARGVQGSEHRAKRTHLVGTGLVHFAHHVHLHRAHIGDGEVELGRGIGTAAHAGVDAAEPVVKDVARLIECEVGEEHLTHLRDQHEPFARDRKLIGQLDVAGEDQDEDVTSAEAIVGWHRTREQRQELGGAAAEHVDAKHAARRPLRRLANASVHRHW